MTSTLIKPSPIERPSKNPLPLKTPLSEGLVAKLIEGDATQGNTLQDNSVDLTITSPPYNVGKAYSADATADAISYHDYMTFSRTWLLNALRWTRSTGRLCVNVALDKNKHGKHPLAADITSAAMGVGWQYHATIIWNEGNISKRTAWGSWMSASAPHVISPSEVVIVFYKDRLKRDYRGIDDITRDEFMDWTLGTWQFNGESAKRIGHEAPFPRELPKRCIKLFSFVGDTVLDPFSGSGTTMIEAVSNKRQAVGVELEPRYIDLSIKRLRQECNLLLEKSSKTGAPPTYTSNF